MLFSPFDNYRIASVFNHYNSIHFPVLESGTIPVERKFMNINIKTTLKIKLSEYLFNATKTDTNYTICKTMLKCMNQFPDITIEQIAYLSNSTPSSVTKFFKKIGYTGFQDIKKQAFNNIGAPSPAPNHFYQDTIEEIHTFYQKLYDAYDHNQIQRIAEILMHAKKVCVISGIHGFAASNLFEELLRPYDILVYEVNRDAEDSVIEDMIQSTDLTIVLSLTGAWIKDRLLSLCKPGFLSQENNLYVLTQNKDCSNSVIDSDHIVVFPGKKEDYHHNLLTSLAEQAFFLLLIDHLNQIKN